MFNFMRFGEKGNSIVFDLTPKEKKDLKDGSITMDEIYDGVMSNPVKHITEVKRRGLERLLAISGIVDGNHELSNGAGKSTLMEAMCYTRYERIVRRTAQNPSSVEKAGLSVVTKIDGNYPINMKESWVEELCEIAGKIYRIRRGKARGKETPAGLVHHLRPELILPCPCSFASLLSPEVEQFPTRCLENTVQNLAAVGKTSSSVRSKSEQLLREESEGLVESTNRKYSYQKGLDERNLSQAQRDTQQELARLQDKTTQQNISNLRQTEQKVGSTTMANAGYSNLLGNIGGDIPRQKTLDATSFANSFVF